MTEDSSYPIHRASQPPPRELPGNYANMIVDASSSTECRQPNSSSYPEDVEMMTNRNREESSDIPDDQSRKATYCSVVLKALKEKRAVYFGIFTLFCIAVGALVLVIPDRLKSTQGNPILAYEERYKAFRTVLGDYSQPWTFAMPNSPQNKALQWLVFMDKTLETSPVDEKRLVQRYALMTLFYTCAGQTWKGPFVTAPPLDEQVEINECDFPAVVCDESGDIISMYASQSGILGSLPDELGLLSQLTILDMAQNDLQGELPAALFERLTNLEILHLDNNNFVSSIPTEIGYMSNLHELHLPGNRLTGTLPSTIGSLDIHILRLQSQSIFGEAVEYIDYWPNLEYINLLNTNATGTIPASIVERKKLRALFLGSHVTGTIPSRLSELTNLVDLWLYGSGIEGSIPSDIDKLTKLETFVMAGVSVTGSIPTTVGGLKQLYDLVLTETQMTGSLPSQIGTLPFLRRISLFSSPFSGTLPDEISNLSNLEDLWIESTRFSGQIATELCDAGISIQYPCTMECSCCGYGCWGTEVVP